MSDTGLKYALALPLETAVEEKIARLIQYADDHVDFYVERWKRREIEKKRKGWLRWLYRFQTDAQILKEIETSAHFWGYHWVKEYGCPVSVQPSTREDLDSLLKVSAYYRATGQTGLAYNSRYLAEYIATEPPEITDWKSE